MTPLGKEKEEKLEGGSWKLEGGSWKLEAGRGDRIIYARDNTINLLTVNQLNVKGREAGRWELEDGSSKGDPLDMCVTTLQTCNCLIDNFKHNL